MKFIHLTKKNKIEKNKYCLLCNEIYSSNRQRDSLSLKFTICLHKTCARCSIREMKNDIHQ